MRRALLHSLLAWLITACMELPDQPGLDAATPFVRFGSDGGRTRPMTGPPYLGPDCEEPGPPSPAHEGAWTADAAPGAERPDSGVEPSDPVAPSPGVLIITEVMSDPQALRDDAGEWFEVHNASAAPVGLAECALDDGAASTRALPPVVLAPRSYAVFARSSEVAFSPAATLAFSLANTTDRLALVCAGVELDRVAYGPGFPLKAGASMALDPEATDAASNDAAHAWCLGRSDLGGELGSPGEANPDCDAAEADAGAL